MTTRRALLAAGVAAFLALAGAGARAADPPGLYVVAPGSNDILLGETKIELHVSGIVAGDVIEVFVDGRPVGRLTSEPWTLAWDAGNAPKARNLTAVLLRDGKEVAVSRVRTRGLGFSATANARVVSVSPIVTDAEGRYVKGLQKEDFTLLVDGRPQAIETFEAVNSNLSAVLVIDVSTSMALKLHDARAAALELLAALKPADRASVLTFASTVVGFTPSSADKAAARAAIEEARVSGETALYDATAVALKKLRETTGRRTVVLFTDGEDNRSRMSVDQVIDLARASEGSIFAVGQGVDEARPLLRALDRMADETGGRTWYIESIKKLPEVFRKVVAELENQYFLTFTPPDQRPRTWHQIEVKVNRPGMKVRAKKSFLID